MSYHLKLKKSIGSKVKMRSVSCYSDKKDDASQNMTVKPSAAMKFYKVVSEVEVSGTEVKLSDVLIMTLELNNEYAGKWRQTYVMNHYHLYIMLFFYRSTIVGSPRSFVCFSPPQWPPNSKECHSRCYPLLFLSYLYSWDSASISL